MPVLFGIATPVFFVSAGLFTKHATKPNVGFNPKIIWAVASFIGSAILLVVGLVGFSEKLRVGGELYTLGFLSAIFDTLGKICVQTAYSKGPAGAVAAFVEMNNVALVIIESIRTRKPPTFMEGLGFILVICGAFVIILSEQFIKLLRKIQSMFRPQQPQPEGGA